MFYSAKNLAFYTERKYRQKLNKYSISNKKYFFNFSIDISILLCYTQHKQLKMMGGDVR